MRVNLQYSVELKNLFEELRSLHLRKNIPNAEIIKKIMNADGIQDALELIPMERERKAVARYVE